MFLKGAGTEGTVDKLKASKISILTLPQIRPHLPFETL